MTAFRGRRGQWLRRIAQLDPVADCEEIWRITAYHEFPWDVEQALSLALFRTYAVPSIGGLLARTGEFTGRTQKRYEDTALLLEAVLEHGFDSPGGRSGLRRINQMHAAYAIRDDDLRHVLSTFVVMPRRWIDAYGWRRLTEPEVLAIVEYYRRLGARMGIKDLPDSWSGFAQLMQEHERAHLGHDAGARAVADATLDLLATIPPNDWLPRRLVHLAARALLDDSLLDAFRLPRPPHAVRLLVHAALRARARVLRLFPPRQQPRHVRDGPSVRLYPHGHDVTRLGTFPAPRR